MNAVWWIELQNLLQEGSGVGRDAFQLCCESLADQLRRTGTVSTRCNQVRGIELEHLDGDVASLGERSDYAIGGELQMLLRIVVARIEQQWPLISQLITEGQRCRWLAGNGKQISLAGIAVVAAKIEIAPLVEQPPIVLGIDAAIKPAGSPLRAKVFDCAGLAFAKGAFPMKHVDEAVAHRVTESLRPTELRALL
ncbi:hypothetical protein WI82_08185 [Burkholderia ubonensis]|nr:hypothetical protein WI82_08185 [Burkholderia ubonensis]